MKTSFEAEMEEQRRWTLLPERAGMTIFDDLVRNEFLTPDEQRNKQTRRLGGVIDFCYRHVPYYRSLFDELGLAPGDVTTQADLVKLPILTKRDLYEHERELQAGTMPKGDRLAHPTFSSGSTGRPAKVAHSERSHQMFGFLRQRNLRFYRFDPAAKFASIRLASQLPRRADGSMIPDGVFGNLPRWLYCEEYFETGPQAVFNVTNPVELILAWLEKEQPAYLMTYPETLEHLAFASGEKIPIDTIRATVAISEQMTPPMKRRIERAFAAPVYQNYGLNEIGNVAVRCLAGRYHVHSEHCIVEIIDDAGRPTAPGETGRVVVTALKNPAMPLIRFDTDDLAQTVSGPCPCGRTLPSFGDIAGRYSRIAFLPEGTLGQVGAIRDALET
ncbi:MAG: phenylacetate--CoA ligase family protein, partial [Alphaproteobacteria bacterium]